MTDASPPQASLPPAAVALLALVLAAGPVLPRRQLLEQHGGPLNAWQAGRRGWRQAGLDERQMDLLEQPEPAQMALAQTWLQQANHHLLGWHDPDYPPLLRRISSPPLALFVEGDPGLLWHASVAVVGSRSPTAAGRDNTRAFVRALADAGIAIASGMAAGIDACAHEAALEAPDGITLAVVGTGTDLAYPRQHEDLRQRIATRGAVISEFPPGTPARPDHFPRRNRILAGLSLATLVMEAAERSGALITARQAGEFGREVFAVPGSIHNPLARGCHRLIREGAGLVESASEVIQALGPLSAELATALRLRLAEPEQGTTFSEQAGPARSLDADLPDPDYQRLWAALGHDPTGMDELVARSGLTTAALSSMLLVMELDGRIALEHGRYSRKTRFLSSTAS